MPLIVLADVLHLEALGQAEVTLHGRQLPQPADRVAEVEVHLRPVERTLTLGDLEGEAAPFEGSPKAPVARSAISGVTIVSPAASRASPRDR